MSPSSKIWEWLQTGHTHLLTFHLEPPLLKFLEITPGPKHKAVKFKNNAKVKRHQECLHIPVITTIILD